MAFEDLRSKGFVIIFVLLMIELRHNSALPNPSLSSKGSHHHNKTTSGHKSGGSFLWQIETTPPSYFFGTIHVPYTRVWDAVPLNAKRAFFKAHRLYLELDLNDHSTLAALSTCQLLPKGMHLSQVIPTDLYLRIKLHLDYVKESMPNWISGDQLDRGLSSDYMFSTMTANWERKLPVWVMLMIESLTKSDVASRGIPVLDLYLSQQARRQRKIIGAIERVEEQCLPLNQINSTLVLFALNETLKKQEEIRLGVSKPHITVDDLIEHYRHGNLDSMFLSPDTVLFPTFALKSSNQGEQTDEDSHSDWTDEDKRLAKEFDKIFQEYFLHRRNQQMAARVINLIVDNPNVSYFFAFGAGHFLGKNSVIESMRNAGFTVKQVVGEESSHKHDIHHKWTSDLNYGADPGNKNTVQGTFEDLSEEEKTRALLQFLQYHQQQEQESETKRFKEMIKGPTKEENTEATKKLTPGEIQDEKVVEESLKVWYGISGSTAVQVYSTSIINLSTVISLIAILRSAHL